MAKSEKVNSISIDPSTDILNTDKEMIEKMEVPFTPIDNKVLIKPMEPIYLAKEIEEPTKPKDFKNKPLKQAEKGPATKVEKKTEVVKANVQRGVVLAVPKSTINDKQPYEVGDVVVFPERASRATFELFRDSILINQYDILGLWDITKQKDRDIYNRTYSTGDSEQS